MMKLLFTVKKTLRGVGFLLGVRVGKIKSLLSDM